MSVIRPDPGEVERIRAAHACVRARIAAAAARSGRDPASVTLVAVSKTVPPERLAAALAAGIFLLGENRVQEAEAKAPLLPGARWHLVGHLQANKAARAVRLFEAIESVDSVGLTRRLDRLAADLAAGAGADLAAGGRATGAKLAACPEVASSPPPSTPPTLQARRRLGVYLQVNVDRDPAKAGFDPEALAAALSELAGLAALELLGLMTVGRLVERAEDARPTFVRLRDLAGELRAREPRLGPGLSMGMSDDFEVAVEEGATLVRIGRAIFGPRPAA